MAFIYLFIALAVIKTRYEGSQGLAKAQGRGQRQGQGEGCWPCRLSGVACSVTFCCMWLKFLTPCSGTLGVMEGGSTGERVREREEGGVAAGAFIWIYVVLRIFVAYKL